MDHTSSYERVLLLPKKGAHLRACILLYCLYASLAILGAVWFFLTLSPYAAGLSVLLEVALILLTRKHLRVEYEYAFLGGTLTVAKIFGRSSRRVVCELDLDRLILVDYLTDDSLQAAARMSPSESADARAVPDAPGLILVWEDDGKSRFACIIESDERTELILRRTRPEACSLALKRSARPAK